LLAGKAAPEDPFERAAMTTRESVRPSAGREYTPQAEEFLTSQFTDPTTIALSVAGGPVGRTLPTIAKAALVGGGMLASSIDPAQGGVLGKLGKTLQGKPWAGAAPHMISEMAAPEFHAALSDAKSKAEYGASVTLHDPQAYKGMQTLTTPDKSAGLALEGDNIASVYKHPDSPIRQAAPSLLADAVKLGGRRLDAFDTDLPHIYGRSGFRAVARIPFDPAEAPKDWSYQTYKKWNDGKPDVVFMVYDPYNPGYQRGMGKMVSSYDEAVALQKQEVARIDERMQQASTQFDQTARQVTGLKGVKQYLTPEELEKVTEAGAEELTRMFRTTPPEELAAAAYAGRAKRGWYKQSAQSLVDIFGIADAPRFVALLAAMSPRISVEGNTINALRTWNAWKKAGSPRTRREILNAMLEGVGGTEMKSVMEAWRNNAIRALTSDDPLGLMLSGPKVDSFWRNLIGRMQEVTNDAWMASFHGVDQDLISGAGKVDPAGRIGPEQLKLSYKGKSPGYLGMSAATRRAADTLSRLTGDVWTPAEIQETVWSWAKTLREKVYGAPGKKGVGGTVEQLLKAGGLTHEEVANTPDFATLFTEGVYRNILEAGGYGKQIKQVEKGLTERRAKGGSDLPSGTPFDPEGTTFTGPAFRRHLLRAGRRLDVGAAGAGE
jgi:hypothetical protein